MSSSSQITQDPQVLEHLKDLRHKREVDWIDQETSQNLQSVIVVGIQPTTATMRFATTSSSRTIQEERNVLGVIGSINLQTARRKMEVINLQKLEEQCDRVRDECEIIVPKFDKNCENEVNSFEKGSEKFDQVVKRVIKLRNINS